MFVAPTAVAFLRSVPAEPGRSRLPAGEVSRPVSGADTSPRHVGGKRLEEVRHASTDLARATFTVRQIAASLDEEAKRLSHAYQRLAQRGGPNRSSDRRALDAFLKAPLIENLSRGVQVTDVHKLLNASRDPLFDEPHSLRGKTAARVFSLAQSVALHVIWRLGHSFHLLPAIRRSIARQLTDDVLRKVVAGREMGLVVTPFLATIGDLRELMDAGDGEMVAVSLNGLICQALRALDPRRAAVE